MSARDAGRPRVVLGPRDVEVVVARLASEIAADFPDGVVLVGVLKGALIFVADLARAIVDVDVEVDFLAISRYAPESDRVRIVQDVELALTGRDVVLVEDIVDTGLTVAYLRGHLEEIGARRVEVCTLVDRPSRRILPVPARYVGVTLGERYVLGYGLHHEDRFRNLGAVLEVDRATLGDEPEAVFARLVRAVDAEDGAGNGP